MTDEDERVPVVVTDRDLVLSAYQEQLQAMSRGNTETLGRMLADGFTLTHITGYRQPKAEWLDEMRAGQFRYHRIDPVKVTVDVTGDRAQLVGRFRVNATVYGSRAVWRLQLAQTHRKQHGAWVTADSVATTW